MSENRRPGAYSKSICGNVQVIGGMAIFHSIFRFQTEIAPKTDDRAVTFSYKIWAQPSNIFWRYEGKTHTTC